MRQLTPRALAAACVIVVCAVLAGEPACAELRGHGGPVRALAVSADGKTALSGSFDQSAIVWSLPHDAAEQVLRVHEGAVNAVAMLPDGHVVTAGEDGRIALWRRGESVPARILAGHNGPVAALAVAPDGSRLASASWDRTVRLWSVDGAPLRVFEGHTQNVNAVAFTADGRALVSAGYDATLRVWPLDGGAPRLVNLPAPLNAVAVAPDGEIVTAGADGKVYLLGPSGEVRAQVSAPPPPIVALALSPDGSRIAAASIRGNVAVIDRTTRDIRARMVGHGAPAWSLAFMPDSRTLLVGGADAIIRRWDAVSGEPVNDGRSSPADDPLAAYAGDPGAEVFRACVACHTLTPDAGNRAGPTLAGIFGRRIATLPGYNFSPALGRLDIVWTPETVAKLFEIGPATYTPGTKMPEQKIGSAADREALVKFLERATVRR